MSSRTENAQILEEASLWLIESRTGELEASRRREFMLWLKTSPEHIRAYLELAESYAHTPGAGSTPVSDTGRIVNEVASRVRAESNVATLSPGRRAGAGAGADVGAGSGASAAGHARKATRRALPIAAAILGLAMGAGALLWYQMNRMVYATGVAEHRSIVLEDGSRIELNGRSRVRVRFGERERLIELLEGEALFQAARAQSRPFIVRSGATDVRALGTQFDVNRRRGETIISVLEGRVAVSSQARAILNVSQEAKPLLLGAGEQAVATVASVNRPHRANTTAATAWTRGQLDFDELALADVIEEFNRHSRREFVIRDAGLGAIRITGVYSSDDPQSFIRFLQNQPELDVADTGSKIVIARK